MSAFVCQLRMRFFNFFYEYGLQGEPFSSHLEPSGDPFWSISGSIWEYFDEFEAILGVRWIFNEFLMIWGNIWEPFLTQFWTLAVVCGDSVLQMGDTLVVMFFRCCC